MDDKKVLLISVGGSPNAIKYSIEKNECPYVIFFCSKDTILQVNSIRDDISGNVKFTDFERIVTNDHENIETCYITLLQRIPEILKLWKCDYDDIVVDYTGGTKVMSAALVLATIDKCKSYSYIGGGSANKEARAKNGIGTVIDGKEFYHYHQNPWDSLGINELKTIDELFSKARYATTVEKLEKLKGLVNSKLKDIYETLQEICMAYYYWDVFKINDANMIFKRSFNNFSKYKILNSEHLDKLIDNISNNMKWVENLSNSIINARNNNKFADAYKMFSNDLIANAIRRAEKENKYEDAVARLYSSAEKFVKGMLLEHGIDNSNTEKGQIPPKLINEFMRYEYKNKENKIRFRYGFDASCRLLAFLDKNFEIRYFKLKDKLKSLMNIRNSSILAHDIIPVSEDTYKKMLDVILKLFEIEKSELVEFPELNINIWGPLLLRQS
jgi:CRISPR-associated protein (TIGR02710 family)